MRWTPTIKAIKAPAFGELRPAGNQSQKGKEHSQSPSKQHAGQGQQRGRACICHTNEGMDKGDQHLRRHQRRTTHRLDTSVIHQPKKSRRGEHEAHHKGTQEFPGVSRAPGSWGRTWRDAKLNPAVRLDSFHSLYPRALPILRPCPPRPALRPDRHFLPCIAGSPWFN